MYDANGNVIDGRAGSFVCRSPVCAEAITLLHVVNLDKQDTSPITIFSDYATVCESLRKPPDSWPWECEATLASIINVLESVNWITIQQCKRQFVSKAVLVARLARDNNLLLIWLVIYA
ncbi:hypothetical protein LINPERPRIM_LOCUS16881 [Linum perenne]